MCLTLNHLSGPVLDLLIPEALETELIMVISYISRRFFIQAVTEPSVYCVVCSCCRARSSCAVCNCCGLV